LFRFSAITSRIWCKDTKKATEYTDYPDFFFNFAAENEKRRQKDSISVALIVDIRIDDGALRTAPP
jgi:hypothetical protein